MRINFSGQSRKTCIPISRGLRRRAMTLYFLLNVWVVSFFFLRRGVNYSLPWWYLLDNRPGTHTTSAKFSSPLYFFFSFSSLEARASSLRLIFSLYPGKNRNSRGGFARDANTQIVFRWPNDLRFRKWLCCVLSAKNCRARLLSFPRNDAACAFQKKEIGVRRRDTRLILLPSQTFFSTISEAIRNYRIAWSIDQPRESVIVGGSKRNLAWLGLSQREIETSSAVRCDKWRSYRSSSDVTASDNY